MQARDSRGELKRKYTKLALLEGDACLKLPDALGERWGLLVELCKFALEFDKLDQARDYADKMYQLAVRFKYSHWKAYAYELRKNCSCARRNIWTNNWNFLCNLL